MQKSKRNSSRRNFLKYSAAASIGLSCAKLGLNEVVAQKKPRLTEQTLNAALKGGGKNSKNVAAEIRRDPKGWAESHFDLTPNQRSRLDSYTAEDFGKIDRILEMVEKNGGTMSARFSNTGSARPLMRIGHPDCPNKASYQVRTSGGNATAEIEK